jgi:hypothetical protein
MMLTSGTGDQVAACVPTTDGCGSSSPDAGTSQPPDAGQNGSCGSLKGPTESASCTSCQSHSQTCQANGCYGGWWCNSDTNRCQSPPSASTCGGSTSPDASFTFPDAGVPTGPVGPQGGTVGALNFAVVGDTRPSGIDDTSGYPVPVITKIWQDIEAENPRPDFAVTTGDYMFARPTGNQAGPQIQMYLQARSNFSNVVFPTMGNHECTGAADSNCSGGAGSQNYSVFMSQMIQPLGQQNPYYSINVQGPNGSWTAKFVFVAANAWDSGQAAWLQSIMAQQTTYTFVVRHERSTVTAAPGVSPSNQIISQFPYTLLIVGHTHTYQWLGNREVVVGNGGAPLTGGVNFGYLLVQQRSDGAIVCTMKDYQSLAVMQTFVLTPTGSPTQ